MPSCLAMVVLAGSPSGKASRIAERTRAVVPEALLASCCKFSKRWANDSKCRESAGLAKLGTAVSMALGSTSSSASACQLGVTPKCSPVQPGVRGCGVPERDGQGLQIGPEDLPRNVQKFGENSLVGSAMAERARPRS